MTKLSFYEILLKSTLLFSLVINLSMFIYSVISFSHSILSSITNTILILGIHWFLILKSKWIVNKLPLDVDIDQERLELPNISTKNILAISLIIASTIMAIQSLSKILNNLTLLLADPDTYTSKGDFLLEISSIESSTAASIVKFILSVILLYHSNRLSNLIAKHSE